MTAMLMPTVTEYFAIYTIRSQNEGYRGQPVWDLHATAADKRTAISHARLLALQPNVGEVQVKHVAENMVSGLVRVREIKRCRKGGEQQRIAAAFAGMCILAAGLIYVLI